MISQGPSVLRLASFINGNPFKPEDLADEGYRVVRIRQLVDEGAEFDFAEPPQRPVFIDSGDLVFSWSATLAVRVWNRGQALLNQHLFRVDPAAGVEMRWLRYVLEVGVELLKPLMHGSAMTHITLEMLRSLTVRREPLDVQRAIADYLDTETARIDALIDKKQRMIELITERGDRAFSSALERRGVPWPGSLEELEEASTLGDCVVIHLSQCLDQLTNGYVGPTRDILVENGIRYIQSLHIKNGQIDFDRRPFFVTPGWHAERPRIHLREDDVLIVQTGDIGQVAVVPAGFGEASCHALQIARVRKALVLGPFLAEYFRSSLGYQSLLSRATGALHPHLEGGIRTTPVIVPSIQVQREVVEEVAAGRRHAADISNRLLRQVDLLRERRQALITAAVTGELEIPGVAA